MEKTKEYTSPYEMDGRRKAPIHSEGRHWPSTPLIRRREKRRGDCGGCEAACRADGKVD